MVFFSFPVKILEKSKINNLEKPNAYHYSFQLSAIKFCSNWHFQCARRINYWQALWLVSCPSTVLFKQQLWKFPILDNGELTIVRSVCKASLQGSPHGEWWLAHQSLSASKTPHHQDLSAADRGQGWGLWIFRGKKSSTWKLKNAWAFSITLSQYVPILCNTSQVKKRQS